MPLSILILSKSPASVNRIEEVLGQSNNATGLAGEAFECRLAEDAAALQAIFTDRGGQLDLCLITDEVTGLSPAAAVTLVRQQTPHIPVIVVVEPDNEAAGLEALRAGAAGMLYWDRLASLRWAMERLRSSLQMPGPGKQPDVASLVREMQTPIAMLGLYTQLLEKKLPDRRLEYLQSMRQQIDALNHLLQNALGESDLDSSDRPMEVVPVDLNQVVGETVEAYRPLAEASGLELLFMPGAGLPEVQGQPRRLAKALANLLLNAIHYTPAGQIEVRTYLYASRSEVCLRVKDTGLGIGREDMAHIFDRYYRGKSATQQRVLGAGLGLPAAKEIVEAHGGWIDAKSEENVGSVFSICLPVVLGGGDERERRILIVENSQLMRSVLQETLEQEGFAVALAEHGRAALALLDNFGPDLILSDVAMPEMDGYAFLDAVRARPEWKAVPFIFITGQSDQKDYLQSQASRGASFLLKPIVIEELLTAIRARLA